MNICLARDIIRKHKGFYFYPIHDHTQENVICSTLVSILQLLSKNFIINIYQETVDGKPRGVYKVGGTRYDLPTLNKMLRDIAKNHPERDVLIRADKETRHAFFAEVVDLTHRAGITKVKIGYMIEDQD